MQDINYEKYSYVCLKYQNCLLDPCRRCATTVRLPQDSSLTPSSSSPTSVLAISSDSTSPPPPPPPLQRESFGRSLQMNPRVNILSTVKTISQELNGVPPFLPSFESVEKLIGDWFSPRRRCKGWGELL